MGRLLYMNESINHLLWGKYMIAFLLCSGAWLLLRTRFLPFVHPILILKKTIGSLRTRTDKQDGVSAFQAVSTALAGTLGVGSIIGVATALRSGGPGALFWMWISALFGMMLKYGEIVLSIHFRKRWNDGKYLGGPMLVLEYGCRLRLLGVLFALFCIFASFGIGNLTPVHTISETIQMYLPIPSIWIGIGIAILMGCIIMGNASRILKVNAFVVPIISILYIGACLFLIALRYDVLWDCFLLVLQDACTLPAATGGIGGYALSKAMHYGIARGVFSHEAGMGSSPLSHASVEQVHPVEQGFWGIFEVFFDTMVICTITGFVVLTSGLLEQSELDGAILMIACFKQGFGSFGGVVFAISIFLFAFPSILGWFYYAKECIRYLFTSSLPYIIYCLLFLMVLSVGGCMDLHIVWDIADTLNGLMMVPNLISLVFLQGIVVKLTKRYIKEYRK